MGRVSRLIENLARQVGYVAYPVWENFQEVGHLRRVLRHFEVDCVLDVGANRGQYALQLRRSVGFDGTIISFEPNVEAFAELARHAAGDSHWHALQFGLGARDGVQDFNVMAEEQFSSFCQPSTGEYSSLGALNTVNAIVQVDMRRLDSIFAELQDRHGFTRPFLKMDTQGYDLEVFAGGVGVHERLIGLQSELAIKRLYDGAPDMFDALTAYRRSGFELNAFIANNEGHFPLLLETDCIMIRKDLLAAT